MNKVIQEIESKVAYLRLEGNTLSLETMEGIHKSFILIQESVSDDSFHESLHIWLMNNSHGYQQRFSRELYSKLELLQMDGMN